MIINDVLFNAELEDIIIELRSQLVANNISLLQKEPKQSGNSLQVQCPYHGDGQERKPSAGIRKSDGMFHCFACNEIHSLPEVISYCFGHTEDMLGKFGWNWLLKNFAILEKEQRNVNVAINRYNIKICGSSRDVGDTVQADGYVGEVELDSYRYYHKYWKERGIVDEKIIEWFDLGYDHNTDCITFPVRDINGNCLFVARRSVKTKFFSYPEGVKKPLYGLYEIYKGIKNHEDALHIPTRIDEVIVCESMIDCILLWQAGYIAVALNGLGNDLQFKQLEELPCRKLILATDNDDAGMKARQRIRKNVHGKLFTEILFPDGKKDIGECTKNELKNLLNWEYF